MTLVDLVARRAHAGQMRGRRQRGLGEDALHRRVGALARRAARAVGHRHEIRPQRREPLDRLPQRALHLLGLRREELERDVDAGAPTWRLARIEITDHHATPCARRHHREPRIAREPERHGDLSFRARLGRQRAMQRHVEPGRAHPLRDRLGREAEAQMRVLLAQEFEVMRREVDDQQPPLRAQRARGLGDRARTVVEEVQHLMDHDDVEGVLRHRQLVDVALAHAAMLQAGALEPRARERQHVERHVDAEPALDARARTARACVRCRCRDRAASGSADPRARSGSRSRPPRR